MAWYKEGTVAVANGSTTVTGTGTEWIANAKTGEEFRLEGGQRAYEITAIVSDSVLTIDPAYMDSTQSGQDYRIVPIKGFLQRAYDALTSAVATIEGHIDGALAGRFGAGTVGQPGLANDSDIDTGFYWKAANQLAAVTGGVQRWLLSSSAMQIDVPITGTAVQSSATDSTSGKLLTVKAFGLGETGLGAEIPDVDATDTPAGTWRFTATSTNVTSLPTALQGGAGVIVFDRAGVTNQRQMAWRNTGDLGTWWRVNNAGIWGDWEQVWDSFSYPAESGTFSLAYADESSNSVTQGAKTVSYIRQGNEVTYYFSFIVDMDLTGLVGTDLLRIPVPFTADVHSFGGAELQDLVSGTGPYSIQAKPSEGYLYFRDEASHSGMTVAQFDASTKFKAATLVSKIS